MHLIQIGFSVLSVEGCRATLLISNSDRDKAAIPGILGRLISIISASREVALLVRIITRDRIQFGFYQGQVSKDAFWQITVNYLYALLSTFEKAFNRQPA